jgi:hypothetical protein
VAGIFSADDSEVEDAIGEEVYFGEILGKHSEVEGVLNPQDFQILTDDQDFIAKFEELGLETGYNPLAYLREVEADEDEDDIDDEEDEEDE